MLQSLLELPQAHRFDSEIDDDIGRTLPGRELFAGPESEGQRALKQILQAYSVFNSTVGYCQGMNFIAGYLFLNIGNKEEAFWTFVSIMRQVRGLFVEGVPLLNASFDILERMIRDRLPTLAAHLARQGVTVMPFASQWFSTLFCFATVPRRLSNRILDIFLYSGYEIVFRVGMAILANLEGIFPSPRPPSSSLTATHSLTRTHTRTLHSLCL